MSLSLHRYGFTALGSPCEVQVYSESRIAAKKLCQELALEVLRLDRKYSRYRTDSVLSEINFSAGSKLGIKIDAETKSLFDHAKFCYEQSEGLYDITSGILRRIWNAKTAKIPQQKAIDALLPRIGFDRLEWNRSRLLLPHGMEIDFGDMIKELAVDAVAKRGRKLGIQHGLVNLGGDFAVIGPQPGNQPWQVGVVNPDDHNALLVKIPLSSGALASCGDYERKFEHDGKHFNNMLNPRTGWPCAGLRAASVAADKCLQAGAIASIALLRNEADGILLLEESTLPYVYMTGEGKVAGPAAEAAVA